MIRRTPLGARTQDERRALVPTPRHCRRDHFLMCLTDTRARHLFSLCSNSRMTDRPASWRMPTPKQMEKVAAEAARRPCAARCGAGCAASGRILGRAAQGSSRRRRRPDARTKAVGDPAPRVARLLPPLRADRGDPNRRRGPPLRRQGSLEGRRAAAARRHVPETHGQVRRRWMLAGLRADLPAPDCRSDFSAFGCLDGPEISPHASVGRRSQGSDDGARQGARDDHYSGCAVSGDACQGGRR
jgi:hypothetical protein